MHIFWYKMKFSLLFLCISCVNISYISIESSITSANSRVLQKARSFRDEFKHRIRRSPSTHRDKLSVSSSSTGSSHKHDKSSPKGRKKLNRGSSFKEESKTEKVCKQTVSLILSFTKHSELTWFKVKNNFSWSCIHYSVFQIFVITWYLYLYYLH